MDAEQNGWTMLPLPTTEQPTEQPKESSPFTCKVAGFYEKNGGKISSDQANKPHD